MRKKLLALLLALLCALTMLVPMAVYADKTPWYAEAMEFATSNGILLGDEHGNLNPTKNTTRAEMATMLMRIFACTQGKSLAHFPDVDQQAWYAESLSIMAEMDIFRGDAGGTMRPNDPITRQEAFAVLSRAFVLASGDPASLNRFGDAASVAEWARADLAGMVEADLLHGDNGNLYPKRWITRAEIAQIFCNMGLQFCSDPEALRASGMVIYTGTAPLSIDGFSGRLYLGGGCRSVTLAGNAPEAAVIVRSDPGVSVQLDGNVDSVHLYARNSTLSGAGSANLVRLCAMGCTASVACGAQESDYDVGLTGVTVQVGAIPTLTPGNRSVSVSIPYKNVDLTGAGASVRTCYLRWYVDGVQQGVRAVQLANSGTVGVTVSESVWKRDMPASRTVKVELLYDTDVVTTQFAVPVQNYTDAEYAQLTSAANPYQIEVVRNQCTVLVYGLDKSGNYSILHHAFVCGPGYSTPLGTFRTPYKARWNPLIGGSYGQYVTQIKGNYLFHSVPYNSMHENDLSYNLYNQLGTICSHGCVRLTCGDAKWIYDNCPVGTTVRIYDSSTLPVPKPTAPWLDTNSPYRGWDPTDPNPNNPWNK